VGQLEAEETSDMESLPAGTDNSVDSLPEKEEDMQVEHQELPRETV